MLEITEIFWIYVLIKSQYFDYNEQTGTRMFVKVKIKLITAILTEIYARQFFSYSHKHEATWVLYKFCNIDWKSFSLRYDYFFSTRALYELNSFSTFYKTCHKGYSAIQFSLFSRKMYIKQCWYFSQILSWI